MVIVGEDVLCWVDEHFRLVAHFDLQADESHVQLVVQDHAHLFELEPLELLMLKGHSVELVLDTRQIVELPPVDLIQILDFAGFSLNGGFRIVCVCFAPTCGC